MATDQAGKGPRLDRFAMQKASKEANILNLSTYRADTVTILWHD